MASKQRKGAKPEQNPRFQDHAGRLEQLLDLSREIAALDTLDAMLERLVDVAVEQTAAERGSLFLHDPDSQELYGRITHGVTSKEIRIADTDGVAGAVFQSGTSILVNDTASDPRFKTQVDDITGYTTKSILCSPILNAKGATIGVVQVLNKTDGLFDKNDQYSIERLSEHCGITLDFMQNLEFIQNHEKTDTDRKKEVAFYELVADITSEIDLHSLIDRVISEASNLLNAERSTLFLNDARSNELFSFVGEGIDAAEIRFPNHKGIAGTVFTTGESINIPHAYADLRFNPSFDAETGFFTRSILCVPVVNKSGEIIGVTQVLNKNDGRFTSEDEKRLRAFTGQVAIALENAKLFEDIQVVKNYNESILQSMSNGVITFDQYGSIHTVNNAASEILRTEKEKMIGRHVTDQFGESIPWLVEAVMKAHELQRDEHAVDLELHLPGRAVGANISVVPMKATDSSHSGSMAMIEDISSEKRIKATMSRYVGPELTDQLMEDEGEKNLLGGKETLASVLFSDVRSFTSVTEQLGAQGTVSLLNDYFGRMMECISDNKGMLDKFIGDAIMAAFGLPVAGEDDEDRALRCATHMLREVSRWNIERAKRGEDPIAIGIGINTDYVVVGNIGSQKRMDYTMIGDGVNLAARLESACKYYKTDVLLAESTKERLRGVYRLREVDRVVVKGKSKPVSIWESLDHHDESSFPKLADTLNYFNDGMAQYRTRNWQRAGRSFTKALKANPKDRVSQVYTERCQHFIANPPGPDWDGTWTLADK